MSNPRLSQLDFQLAYLVLLTRYGLKPLSRWERALGEEAREVIREAGLVLSTVERRTRIGRKVVETVFARRPGYPELYARRMNGTRIRHAHDVVRFEGRVFGYPSCCVEAFIRSPYAPNGLAASDQEILFHWACPDCRTTPALVREYRRIQSECAERFVRVAEPRRGKAPRLVVAAARAAASAALLAGTAGLSSADDPHWLPVADDFDQDFLSFAEEVLKGTDWYNPDTDQNLVLDGVQTSHLLRELIAAPPPGVEVEEHWLFGVEACTICGELVNMGGITITHTVRGLTADLPFIALHYLEHGCLQYDGELHQGRVDLDLLKRILLPCDPPHLLPPVGEDPDLDGLLSEEEPPLGTDPEDPDTDHDSLLDGPQVVEHLVPLIAQLPRGEFQDGPYLLEFLTDGLEQCEVCGVTYNMGHVLIVNPREELEIAIPFVGLHTLAHGGLVYDGTFNEGRVLPVLLRTMLTGDGTAHWLPVPDDSDGDGLMDEEEPYFGLDETDPDEDGNGIPDGRQLAAMMAARIHTLPEGPLENETYVIHHLTFGHYNCLICGEAINMGFLEITDPTGGLSVNVPYYNLHFMDHGGFSTDREDIYPRVDPCAIGAVLGIQTLDVEGVPIPLPFAFWNAPNPFGAGTATTIVLSLPKAAERVTVAVYDNAGRKVRDLYAGEISGAASFRWDGRDDSGRPSGPGIYFCKVRLGSLVLARKMTLVK